MALGMQNGKLKGGKYVPWMAIVCFVMVTVGMIVWAVGTTGALDSTNTVLHSLQVTADSTLKTVHDAAVAAVVVCMIMALLMVFMALGRTSLERKIDEEGKAVCGTWMWLAVEALLVTVWWIIVFWMVFIIFGSCIWYSAAFTVEGAISASLVQMQVLTDAAAASNTTAAVVGTLNSPAVLVTSSGNHTVCPSACFNLAYFSYYTVVQDSCICSSTSLTVAYNAAASAAKALQLTVAGSFVMWVGSSFLLMVAVSMFASTKRERELLLRAQRHAAEQAASGLAQGKSEYKDTQPLLRPPQQQAAVQMVAGQVANKV